MEHAGWAVARASQRLLPAPSSPILIACGTGFNGGDGLAAARHLHDWGYPLRLVLAGRADRLREEPAVYAAILSRLGVSLVESASLRVEQLTQWMAESGVIIDALLGVGASGAVREPLASWIRCMNESGKPIVAVDIPSGLDGDTGEVRDVAVRATVTVSFGLPKRGSLVREGPAHVGSLLVDSISIPHTLLTP